jgi:tight adherence protein B
MDTLALIRIGFYLCVAIAAIMFVEGMYSAIVRPLSRKRNVNRRLKAANEGIVGEAALVSLLQERGVTRGDGHRFSALNSLVVQSGLRLTLGKLVLFLAVAVFVIFSSLSALTTLQTMHIFLITVIVGLLIPLQVLRFIRARRQNNFSAQLPDALDVIVRSLRSGHPVPVAMAMVGREMPDPVGSEFGLTIDEMTYGLDMPHALQNLAERVGVSDLSLMVTAVSLQSTSGGNLAEVLSNLSKILRDRFQLRRKVRSLSAEGRFSGYGLAILPMLIAFAIFAQNPGYYFDVWEEPQFLPGMVALLVWSLIGDLIMYKMINFKY